MGIWDSISGTTDSLKRNAPDLTAVKNWCPAPGSLKQIVPDVTAAKNGCSTAYGYLDSAVRSNLNHCLQDEEARSKILQFGKSILKHAAIDVLKTIPGYKTVVKSIRDVKDSDKQEVDVKALQAVVHRLEKELSKDREFHEQVPIDMPSADLKSPNTFNFHPAVNQKPEDVIRVFMMKEFMGRKLFDDLMVPPVAPRKK